jgi:hypothetical protein
LIARRERRGRSHHQEGLRSGDGDEGFFVLLGDGFGGRWSGWSAAATCCAEAHEKTDHEKGNSQMMLCER